MNRSLSFFPPPLCKMQANGHGAGEDIVRADVYDVRHPGLLRAGGVPHAGHDTGRRLVDAGHPRARAYGGEGAIRGGGPARDLQANSRGHRLTRAKEEETL